MENFDQRAGKYGIDPEEARRRIDEARKNTFVPFSDEFEALYSECALESTLRQMTLLESNPDGPGAWNIDLSKAELVLSNVGTFRAQCLGTSTPVEFLWCDANHPSADTLVGASQLVGELRQSENNLASLLPELFAGCLDLQTAQISSDTFGHKLCMVLSVLSPDMSFYYRCPSSPHSALWVLLMDSPIPVQQPESMSELFSQIRTRLIDLLQGDPIMCPSDHKAAVLGVLQRRGVYFVELQGIQAILQGTPYELEAHQQGDGVDRSGWSALSMFVDREKPDGGYMHVVFDTMNRVAGLLQDVSPAE